MVIVPIYLVILIVIVNRYLAGLFFRLLRGQEFDRARWDNEPTVTVVIPMFNEGDGIYRTIHSLLKQEYPAEKLSICVVDDCSKDDSYLWAKRAAAYAPDRVRVLKNPRNMGKRQGINRAVRSTTSEIIVSVDSDVVVAKDAVKQLVARFTDEDIAAVGGRVSISNPHQNWLTRMQTIKYHFGYVYLKNLERAFQSVFCLSGCLTAYRRTVLVELEPILENRNLLGIPIKYGEDRFLTRQIVKAGYKTVCTLDAKCWTVAPATLEKYFAQQLRWRRSNLVDFLFGITHVWRLNPFVGVHYYSLFALQVVYPVIVVRNFMSGRFFELSALHMGVLAGLGTLYFFESKEIPREERVHPLYFLSLGLVMPVTYLLHNVLAFWTLDSGSWETRGHNTTLGEAVPAVSKGKRQNLRTRSASEARAASSFATRDPRQLSGHESQHPETA